MEKHQNPTLDPSPSQGRENPLIVWKNSGETLDQLLDRVRLAYSVSQQTRMTYAGRLDPLASGIMILLVGDGVHDKELYNKLDKRYRATVVLGFETDTYDVLGLCSTPPPAKGEVGRGFENYITNTKPLSPSDSPPSQGSDLRFEYLIKNILEKQVGTHTQTYPPYSSKNVNGVPLWKLARDGNLPEVLPSREVVVYGTEMFTPSPAKGRVGVGFDDKTPSGLSATSPFAGGGPSFISGEDLLKEITNIVSHVTGDFRQEEILASWEKNIVSRETYQVLEIDYYVGSGTYIRGLVHQLGQQLGTVAVLLGLERYQVGNYGKSDIL